MAANKTESIDGGGLSWSRQGRNHRLVVEPVRSVGALLLGLSTLAAGFLLNMGLTLPRQLDLSSFAPLIFLGPVLGCFYFGLVVFFNRRTLEIGPKEITVSIAPFPWPGSVKLNLREISGFALEKKVRRGDNGHNVSYNLAAQIREGGTRPLLKSLPKKTAKRALELVREFDAQARSPL
jgi:hypothetical protein